ncbi:fungal-specific transcription factor domain-containing protein [Ilyonectria robusta]|uniref:fungal-specific transcription factor domain-containing protein n=1 Tax=Ilyonectria robusta TaxID=1079257 RepID=UPI001E8DA28D|nr:fungal-specific transcription factor domain-containing protein [Ilyonectria robusta]KAH8663792.1 fungal-specific transcription factor domain-containing protein [Ilyonectria robusta]
MASIADTTQRKNVTRGVSHSPQTIPDPVHEHAPTFSPPQSVTSAVDADIADAPEVSEEYNGDASVDAFLRRVSGHLAQIGQGLPRNLFKRHEEDDHIHATNYIQTLALPDKSTATSCLDAYFDHGNATCRFLPRDQTFKLLDDLYTNDDKLAQNHANTAIILLVIGTGCVWTASWKNESVAPWRAKALPFLQAAGNRLEKVDRIYPPTIGVLQAQLLKCQCELVLGRFNSAWMSLGWAIRLGQMIDIQREQQLASVDPLQAYYRRRLFWSMFMIDRYLAVILGRPMAIQDSDVTVELTPNLDDTVSSQVDAREKKLLMGTTVHYRQAQPYLPSALVKIIGRAASQLYPVADRAPETTDAIISELESELQRWLQTTPDFFHPKTGSLPRQEEQYYDTPWILKRQQPTVQAAFFFAKMLIYRGPLLRDFRRQEPNKPPTDPLSDNAKKCAESALAMVALASEFGVDDGKYNGIFWITSHFVFCAISILLVYLTLYQDHEDRFVVEKAVEDAMAFQRKLDNSVNISAQKLLDVQIPTPLAEHENRDSPLDVLAFRDIGLGHSYLCSVCSDTRLRPHGRVEV